MFETSSESIGSRVSPQPTPSASLTVETVTVPGGGTEESWLAAAEALARGQRVRMFFDDSVSPVLRTAFDVDAYTRLDHGRLPVDAAVIPSSDLDGPLRTTLGVLQRLEASALAEARAMLVTWTGNEARITAFLATWLVERYWQARALRDLLTGDHPTLRPEPGGTVSRRSRMRRWRVDRVQPLVAPAWTVLAGEGVTAGHMARLAIQEASLQASLRALLPRLQGEVHRVVDEVAERHQGAVDFFTAEALARVSRSRQEAISARLVLAVNSPLDGGGIIDPDLPAALRTIAKRAEDRAALRGARFEITRLLPGPVLPDPYLSSLGRRRA